MRKVPTSEGMHLLALLDLLKKYFFLNLCPTTGAVLEGKPFVENGERFGDVPKEVFCHHSPTGGII